VVDAEDRAPDLLPAMREEVEAEDRVPDLPEIPQLQHLAKNRPRRPKRHASSGSVGQLLGESEASSSSADLKDGLETFFAKQAVSPLGSPCLDEVHGSRHGSFSSTSSVSRSREDVRETKQNIKSSPLALESSGRGSPAEPEDKSRSNLEPGDKPRSGLSCLLSSTSDEDREPLANINKVSSSSLNNNKMVGSTSSSNNKMAGSISSKGVGSTTSPEKVSLVSPSGRTISDIFGKVAQEKVSKNKVSEKPSPFTGRRSETEVFSNRRRSFLPGGETEKAESPEEAEGDEVVRRGRGLGGDILKEMKVRQELKRASVIPKTESVDAVDGRADDKPFANMHIR